MIDNMDQIKELVAEAIGSDVYEVYPQKKTKVPFAIVVQTSNNALLTDRFGEDIVARMDYSVQIFAKNNTELRRMEEAIVRAGTPIRFRRMGKTPGWSDQTHGPTRILFFEMVLDKRNTPHIIG